MISNQFDCICKLIQTHLYILFNPNATVPKIWSLYTAIEHLAKCCLLRGVQAATSTHSNEHILPYIYIYIRIF